MQVVKHLRPYHWCWCTATYLVLQLVPISILLTAIENILCYTILSHITLKNTNASLAVRWPVMFTQTQRIHSSWIHGRRDAASDFPWGGQGIEKKFLAPPLIFSPRICTTIFFHFMKFHKYFFPKKYMHIKRENSWFHILNGLLNTSSIIN